MNISLILISFVASLQSLKRLKIMAKFELKLPKMGESVAEATINSWLKEIGDKVEVDESVIEISTDKVDRDVPSEVSGILIEKKFNVDDVVEAVVRFIKKPPKYQIIKPGNKQTKAPAQIFNVGNGKPVSVNTLVGLIEDSLGKKAVIRHKPRPAEDMQITHANIQELERVIGPLQTTSISEGIYKFVSWYKEYQTINPS